MWVHIKSISIPIWIFFGTNTFVEAKMDKILLEIHKKRHPRNIAEHCSIHKKQEKKRKKILLTQIKTCGMVQKKAKKEEK